MHALQRWFSISWLTAGTFLLGNGPAFAGRIVVANDEFPLADSGFLEPNDPARFALNVGTWFVDARPGRFLAISNDQGLTGSQLAATMVGAGHQWTVTTQVPANLEAMKAYDAVFLCVTPMPPLLLIDYVNAGGNVYLASRGVEAEATLWNPFLRRFGLEFSPVQTGGPVDQPLQSSHPLLAGVDHLRQIVGSSIRDLDPGDPTNEVIASAGGLGLFAVADSLTYFDSKTPFIRVSEIEISWRSETNTTYRIDYRSALTGNVWTPLNPTNCLTGDGSILRYFDRVAIQEPRRYYRIVSTNCPILGPTSAGSR